MVRTALVALLVGASATQPAQQFNLVCTGKLATVALGVNSEEPYARTLRVDLKAKQWCADACHDVNSISRVEPNRIVLRDDKQDTPREYSVERESVDRVTGAHGSVSEWDPTGPNPHSVFRIGQCAKAPFSGFSDNAAKF